MNKDRRNRLSRLMDKLQEVIEELESIRDEEDECRGNMPENLQDSEHYGLSEMASQNMEEALDYLDSASESIGYAME